MKRNKFSLSHYKLLTGDMGQLIPITWFEALPGDSIQQATSCLIRVNKLLRPVMHPVMVRIHHFFVPNRIIWEDFEDFITGGPDGTSVPTHPYKVTDGTHGEGHLLDYLGLPTDAYATNLQANALPIRAYNKIFNDYFRDQDLVTELTSSTASGNDTTSNTVIQRISWPKDYFTTCRTTTQKGSDVTIPLGTTAPVTASGTGIPTFDGSISGSAEKLFTGTGYQDVRIGAAAGTVGGDLSWNDPKLVADLSSATGIDIADLRLALKLQEYKEARQRYGSRYVEYLRYLGVRSSDARLQNAEYLGGGRQVINFSEVLSSDGSNTGDMKGHGITAIRTNRYRRFFEEHGIVMSLMSVVPKPIYESSVNRAFLRTTKEDYFQKELQFIGEQEVTNREIHADHTTPDGVFGYQARYDEYRSIPSTVSSEFRSTNNDWHYARIFASDPALNSSFITATPTKRVNADTVNDCLYVMANHSIQARRMLAKVARNRL